MSSFARGQSSSSSSRGGPRTRATSRGSSSGRGGQSASRGFGRGRASSFITTSRGAAQEHSADAHQTFQKSKLSNMRSAQGSWQERYTALQESRKRERSDAIKHGLMADPDKPTSLADAITLVGTCQDMCAEFERIERVVQKDVWKEEVDASRLASNPMDREPDETRMVKKFRRAAAGIEEQLPSDLRPPPVLQMTCDYLFNDVIGAAESLSAVHHFVWDRTRAIRNDFSIQQLSRPEDLRVAVNCYEQIARFHILSLHQLALPEKPYEKYDWQQEHEQLDRTLLSLIQYYDDSRGKIQLQNEPEFRAYCVIFQLRNPDPDLEEKLQTWPRDIALHPRVRAALELYAAACNTIDTYGPLKPAASHAVAQQDWHRVWQLIEGPKISYLMACVAEIHFKMIRENVLQALLKSGGIKNMSQWSLEELQQMMAFDTEDSVVDFCAGYDLAFIEREGHLFLDLSSLKNKQLPGAKANALKQSKSMLVEQKRGGRTLPAVIAGLSFKEAVARGMIADEPDSDMEDIEQEHDQTVEPDHSSDDGLFVTQDKPAAAAAAAAPPTLFKAPFASTAFQPPSSSPFRSPFAAGNTAPAKSMFGQLSAAPSDTPQFSFGKPSGPSVTSSQPATTPSLFTPKDSADVPAANTLAFDFLGGLKRAENTPSSSDTTPTAPSVQPNLGNSIFTSTKPAQTDASIFAGTTPAQTIDVKSVETTTPKLKSQETFARTTEEPSGKQLPTFSWSTPSANATFETTSPIDFTKPPVPQAPASQAASQAAPQPSLFSTTVTTTAPTQKPTSSPFTTGTTGLFSPPTTVAREASRLPSLFDPSSNGASPQASSNDTQPKAQVDTSSLFSPAPKAQVDTSSLFSSVTKTQQDTSIPPPVKKTAANRHATTPQPDLDSIVRKLARELTLEPEGGFLKQYVDFVVSQIVTEVQEKIYYERIEEEAIAFRQQVIINRYGLRWRDTYRRGRLVRQARDRKARAFRRLNDHKSQTSAASSVAGDASILSRVQSPRPQDPKSKRQAVDKLFQQSAGPSKWAKAAADQAATRESRRQSISSQATDGSLRRSIGRVDLSGRIVKPTRTSQIGASPARCTTKSNYFRMKALGLDKIDALAQPRKRAHSEVSSEASEQSWTSPQALPTLAIEPAANFDPPMSPRSKLLKVHDEEDALFARLRAAREHLQQGMSLYRAEVAKSESPRSTPQIGTASYDSPSMQRARQEARWRNDSADVPAYRLRESRFVPRWPATTPMSPAQLEPAPVLEQSTLDPQLSSTPHVDTTVFQAQVPSYEMSGQQNSISSHTLQDTQSQTIFGDSYVNGFPNLADSIESPVGAFPPTPDMREEQQSHDFTIKSSQIPESLTASFGAPSAAQIAEAALHESVEQLPPSDQADYDKWAQAPDSDHNDSHQMNGLGVTNGHEEHSLQPEPTYTFQSNNPYAALQMDDATMDTENDAEDEDEDQEEEFDDEVNQYRDSGESYEDEYGENGACEPADDAEEDISEEDPQLDREDDEEEQESEEYESDADEDEDEDQPSPAQMNPALQVVGNTEDDAIELSD